MKIVVKPSFDRDIDRVRDKELRLALDEKIEQIECAKSAENVTGVKLLRGYASRYRIIVKSGKFSYRIGAIIRNDKIWLVRFLPRKIIYRNFP